MTVLKVKSLNPFYRNRKVSAVINGENKTILFDQNGELELTNADEVVSIYDKYLDLFNLDPEFDFEKLDTAPKTEKKESKIESVVKKTAEAKELVKKEDEKVEDVELVGRELTDKEREGLKKETLATLKTEDLVKIAKVSGLYKGKATKYNHAELANFLFENKNKLKGLE